MATRSAAKVQAALLSVSNMSARSSVPLARIAWPTGSMAAADVLGLDAAALRLLALADVRALAAVRRSIHQARRCGLPSKT